MAMKSASLTVAAAALALLIPSLASGADARTSRLAETPRILAAAVHDEPTPLPGTDRRRHLVYEVLLENRASVALRFDRLQVRAGRRVLAAYRDQEVAGVLTGPDVTTPTRTLAAGERGAVFLDVALRPGRRAPGRLVHRFVLTLGDDGPARRAVITAAPTRVERKAPLRIAPPLRGGNLAVIGCCGAVLGHRRALQE